MNELISREAVFNAINRIKTKRNETWYEFYQKIMTAVGKILHAEPLWIPCSERLPERSGNYLVTRDIISSYGYEPEACAIDYFEADQLNWDGYGNLVIAWMQLPEPYQKGDAE